MSVAVRRSRLALFSAAFAPAALAVAVAAAVAMTGCATTPPARDRAMPVAKAAPAQPARPAPHAPKLNIDRDALRAQLAAARAQQIARLRDYRAAGFFPLNRVDPTAKINVFVDPDTGALCAVANLMSLSGKDQLVRDTAARNNLIRLADVQNGPLVDWILHSGLTHEEVVFIQEPYEPYRSGFEDEEIERLRAHFVAVEEQLLRDNDASLDLAVDRLIAGMVMTSNDA